MEKRESVAQRFIVLWLTISRKWLIEILFYIVEYARRTNRATYDGRIKNCGTPVKRIQSGGWYLPDIDYRCLLWGSEILMLVLNCVLRIPIPSDCVLSIPGTRFESFKSVLKFIDREPNNDRDGTKCATNARWNNNPWKVKNFGRQTCVFFNLQTNNRSRDIRNMNERFVVMHEKINVDFPIFPCTYCTILKNLYLEYIYYSYIFSIYYLILSYIPTYYLIYVSIYSPCF